MEAVFSIVRGIYGREHDDPMDDLDLNMAIGDIFVKTTLRAAVHLGQDHEANLRYVKNHVWKSVGQRCSKKRSKRTIAFKDATWMSTSPLCKKAFRFTNAKSYVLSDSVLFVRKMGDDAVATWKSKIKWYSEDNHFNDMNRIDGMPTEFEWKIFPGITTLGLLEKTQSLMRDLQSEPIIFMSMFHDIVWDAEQITGSCGVCSRIPSRSLVFLGAWIRRKVVRNLFWQTRQIMGSICREYDGKYRYFVPPVPLREENCEAKEVERSRYTSMVAMKPSSCFSAQWFLRISSVSTEQ